MKVKSHNWNEFILNLDGTICDGVNPTRFK